MASVPTYVAPTASARPIAFAGGNGNDVPVAPGGGAPVAPVHATVSAHLPSVAHPHQAAGQDRDAVRTVGLAAVFVSAAILSFDTLNRLASAVGWTGAWHIVADVELRLSWLLPIAVDCYAWLTVREWLRGTAGARRTRYAARSARVALGLTMAANALFHAFDALHWSLSDNAVAAIVVGAIPPFLAERVAVMFTLGRTRPGEVAGMVDALTAGTTPVAVGQPACPRATNPASRDPKPRVASVDRANGRNRSRDNVDAVALVLPLVAQAAPSAPSQRRVRAHLQQHGISVGFPRAKQLIAEATERAAVAGVASN